MPDERFTAEISRQPASTVQVQNLKLIINLILDVAAINDRSFSFFECFNRKFGNEATTAHLKTSSKKEGEPETSIPPISGTIGRADRVGNRAVPGTAMLPHGSAPNEIEVLRKLREFRLNFFFAEHLSLLKEDDPARGTLGPAVLAGLFPQ